MFSLLMGWSLGDLRRVDNGVGVGTFVGIVVFCSAGVLYRVFLRCSRWLFLAILGAVGVCDVVVNGIFTGAVIGSTLGVSCWMPW